MLVNFGKLSPISSFTQTRPVAFEYIVMYVPFLLLCTFRSLYSVYCLCVHVCSTAATGYQPICG
jgi:hypothetical protein